MWNNIWFFDIFEKNIISAIYLFIGSLHAKSTPKGLSQWGCEQIINNV